MRPQTIGRALGIGLRVAGRVAGQRIAAAGQPEPLQAAAAAEQQAASAELRGRSAGKTAGRTTKGLAKGVGGFLRPFTRVGGLLWLEVTGAFFFLFVVVSGYYLWQYRADYARGPNHLRFLAAAGMLAVFLYLSVSSFWRTRKR